MAGVRPTQTSAQRAERALKALIDGCMALPEGRSLAVIACDVGGDGSIRSQQWVRVPAALTAPDPEPSTPEAVYDMLPSPEAVEAFVFGASTAIARELRGDAVADAMLLWDVRRRGLEGLRAEAEAMEDDDIDIIDLDADVNGLFLQAYGEDGMFGDGRCRLLALRAKGMEESVRECPVPCEATDAMMRWALLYTAWHVCALAPEFVPLVREYQEAVWALESEREREKGEAPEETVSEEERYDAEDKRDRGR